VDQQDAPRPARTAAAPNLGDAHVDERVPKSGSAIALAPRRFAGAAPTTGAGRHLAGVLVLAAVYYGAAKLGYELEFSGPVAAIVWLPAGVAIAFLYLGGLRFWPGVLVGDLLANNYTALPFGSALGQTTGNMLEVVVAVVLLRRIVPHGSPLDTVSGLGGMVAAIAAGTAVSATIGSLSLHAGGVITAGQLPEVWRTWWLGDASGALVVVPLALAWYRPPPRAWTRARAVEAAAMLATVAGLSELAFRGQRPLAYLAFPALVWAALRFGRRGATLAIAVAVGFTVWNTTHSEGPFVFDSITLSVLSAQLYIAVASLLTLCLAAVVWERENFADGLDASRSRLVKAADTERRRIEHNLHDGAQQRLSALATRLGLAAAHARRDDPPAAPALEDAETELGQAIDELRELAHGIHPAVLTDLGLGPAIRGVALRSTVAVSVGELPTTRFNESAEATAYYVFVEALTNAQRHARATSVSVRATLVASVLRIEVVDDGAGGTRERAGGGLTGLRDRVEALGGTFDIDSADGAGTRIAAAIPAAPPGSRT
jgi:signal transduction histidine kinase